MKKSVAFFVVWSLLCWLVGPILAEAQGKKFVRVDTVVVVDTITVPVDTLRLTDTVTVVRVDTVPRVCPICPGPTPPPDTTTPPPPPPPPSGGGNEPGGLTRLSRVEPAAIPPYPASGGWWSYPYPDWKLASVADASAPSGDGTSWEVTIPSGMNSGASITKVAPDRPAAPQKRLYVRHWIRLEGTAFEAEYVYTKLWFIGYGGANTAHNEGILGFSGSFQKGLAKQCWPLEFRQQNHVTRNLRTTGQLCAGRWAKVEVYAEVNTIGSANGKLRIWLDGALILDKTDVVFLTSTAPQPFNGWMWNFVWGGVSGYTHSRTDKIRIDAIYVSGAN